MTLRPTSDRPRVYPRVCGGTRTLIWKMRTGRGLSPRVRGNHSAATVALAYLGSIPACAGEPAGDSATLLPTRVYPRVCGGTLASGAT